MSEVKLTPYCSHHPTAHSHTGLPAKQGLYDPRYEHDACGVGFVVTSRARSQTPLSHKAWRFYITLRIAARADASRTLATEPECSCRCPTNSCVKSRQRRELNCLLRGTTLWG